jgi:hypothetical protein
VTIRPRPLRPSIGALQTGSYYKWRLDLLFLVGSAIVAQFVPKSTAFPPLMNFCRLAAVRIASSNFWRQISQNAAGSNILVCSAAASTLTVAGGWTHFVMSWDLSVPVVQLYINGVSDGCAKALTDTNDIISYSTNQKGVVVGSLQGSNFLTGDLADVFFDEVNRVDLSDRTTFR